MVRKKNRRLTLEERVQIETLLQQNKTKAYIAKIINRSRSTVSREVNKLGSNPKVDYDAYLAR
jgi:IS30 family transposase